MSIPKLDKSNPFGAAIGPVGAAAVTSGLFFSVSPSQQEIEHTEDGGFRIYTDKDPEVQELIPYISGQTDKVKSPF